MIDVVGADTTVGAFHSYSPLRVPTSKRSGGDSESVGSLVGRKKGRTRRVEKRDGSRFFFASFPLVGRKRSRGLVSRVVKPPLFSSSLVSGGLSLIGYQAKRRKMRGGSDRGNDRCAVFNSLTSTPSDATSLQLSTERAGGRVLFAKPTGARLSNDRPKVSRVMRFNKNSVGGKKKRRKEKRVFSPCFL